MSSASNPSPAMPSATRSTRRCAQRGSSPVQRRLRAARPSSCRRAAEHRATAAAPSRPSRPGRRRTRPPRWPPGRRRAARAPGGRPARTGVVPVLRSTTTRWPSASRSRRSTWPRTMARPDLDLDVAFDRRGGRAVGPRGSRRAARPSRAPLALAAGRPAGAESEARHQRSSSSASVSSLGRSPAGQRPARSRARACRSPAPHGGRRHRPARGASAAPSGRTTRPGTATPAPSGRARAAAVVGQPGQAVPGLRVRARAPPASRAAGPRPRARTSAVRPGR